MNLDRAGVLGLLSSLREAFAQDRGADVAVFPPFPYLALAVDVCAGTPIVVGAQNCHFEAKGAFTGEVSPQQVRDTGARSVILGHSERRHLFHEGDALIAKKVAAALAAKLDPILCVGETLEERNAGRTEAVVLRQLVEGFALVPAAERARVTVAYEPVWAIGTGVNATAAQAAEVHSAIRNRYAEQFGRAAADDLRILYGGSATPESVVELFRAPGIDGGLVGGASLDARKFTAIVDIALEARRGR